VFNADNQILIKINFFIKARRELSPFIVGFDKNNISVKKGFNSRKKGFWFGIIGKYIVYLRCLRKKVNR